MLLLTASIALPFFFLSTTGPLLQRWFAGSGHRDAGSPWFLYSASNAGSLVALLAYPLVIESRLRLAEQCGTWSVAYLLMLGLTVLCAAIAWRETPGAGPDPLRGRVDFKPERGTTVYWVLGAAVPSGMMLAVTTYLTTDIAPIPLLWIIPLSLYLLSFVLVFARKPWPRHEF